MLHFVESSGQVRRSPVSCPRLWTFMSNTKAVENRQFKFISIATGLGLFTYQTRSDVWNRLLFFTVLPAQVG